MRKSSTMICAASLLCSLACDPPREEAAEAPHARPGSPESAVERPQRVQPAVTILAVDVDCPAVPVFFDADSATLGDDDRQTLATLAQCLQGTGEAESVRVVGMASAPGGEDYNDVLAAQRATNVASFLRMNGVSEGRFRITAIGEDGATAGMPELYPAQRAAVIVPRDPRISDTSEDEAK